MVLIVPLNLVLVGVWINLLCVRHAVGLPCWFWATMGVLWVTVVPLRLVTRYRRLAEAERANNKLH